MVPTLASEAASSRSSLSSFTTASTSFSSFEIRSLNFRTTSEGTETSPLWSSPKGSSQVFPPTPPRTWRQDASFDGRLCRLHHLLQNLPLRLPHQRDGAARAAGSGRPPNTVDVVFHRGRHGEVDHLSETAEHLQATEGSLR